VKETFPQTFNFPLNDFATDADATGAVAPVVADTAEATGALVVAAAGALVAPPAAFGVSVAELPPHAARSAPVVALADSAAIPLRNVRRVVALRCTMIASLLRLLNI
jgi:predicted RNA-binding Zn ribbon-like protein